MHIHTFPMTLFMTNCFVVTDGDEALVIDPGEASAGLLACLKGKTVRTIVNTHGHCDHCGGNAALVEKTHADLVCHSAELLLLRMLPQQGQMFGVPFPPSPEPTRFIEDGDRLTVGGITLTVRHTPGHSPGHVILTGDGFVFAGDLLFAGSVGRTDLPGGSYEQLRESIRTKLLTLPDDTVVYCGHGPTTTIGAERRSNPFLAGL